MVVVSVRAVMSARLHAAVVSHAMVADRATIVRSGPVALPATIILTTVALAMIVLHRSVLQRAAIILSILRGSDRCRAERRNHRCQHQ